MPLELKRCSKCILPETYPSIKFDKEGVCNICKAYQPIKYKGEKALTKLLETEGKGKKWDCLVPLSGGRDSSYTLYNLVNKYRKRVLVYNYDNGFVESVARENVQRIADTLGVDVVYKRSCRNIQCRHVAAITKMNLRKTPAHVMAFLCSGCRNGIWGGAYQVAKKRDIPLVVFGESAMESGGFKKKLIPQFMPTSREKISFMLKMPLNFIQRKYLDYLLNKEFPLDEFQRIHKINFFDYEEWDEEKIEKTIREKLGWKQKEGQSSWRFDCQIHSLVNLMIYQLLGMTEKDELYSKQIREGKMTRDEALSRVSQDTKTMETELSIARKVLERMGLNQREKEKILRFCQGMPRLKNEWV